MKITQSCPTLCNPIDYTAHRILQARILEWVAVPFSRRSSQSREWTQVSALQADSLAAEPLGKPKNTAVGSLSLLQGIPSQPRNWTGVSCITGGFFTSRTTRQALLPWDTDTIKPRNSTKKKQKKILKCKLSRVNHMIHELNLNKAVEDCYIKVLNLKL